MTLRTAGCALLLMTSLLISCGDDDRDGSRAYESSCEAACTRLHECNSNVGIDDCSMDCKEDAMDVGPNLSMEFLSALDDCVADANCVQLQAQPVSQACQREAAARVGPTAAAEELCDAVVASLQMCLGVSVATTGCLEGVKIFSDPVLRRARTCDQMPCNERSDCLEAVLGTDPTDM